MTNGDDAIEMMETSKHDALGRIDDWDKGIKDSGKSDHGHSPLRDGIKIALDNNTLTHKRVTKMSDKLDGVATKEDLETLSTGIETIIRKKKTKKVPIFGGLMHVEPLESRDVGRAFAMAILLWMFLEKMGIIHIFT